MTPSNTSNGNPFVYDVQDAQGVKHQIVPVDHTHPLSEISDYPGSESTPTLGSSKLVTSGGVKTALNGKMDNKTIDSTPTANSTNLVTSGGVKTALNGKMDNKTIDQTPTDGNTTHLISSDAVYEALKDMAKWETVVQVNLGQGGTDVYSQYGIFVRENSDKMFVYQQIRLVPIGGSDAICEYGAVKAKGTGPYYIISDIDMYAIAGTHHTITFNLQVLQ